MSILIAGAGPAGARLAINLAKKGIKVTLVDRLLKPTDQCFSSAAVPITSVNELSIPEKSISSYWSIWQIYGPNQKKYIWQSNNNIGAILNFAVLRDCLWNQSRELGVDLLLGRSVQSVRTFSDHAIVSLKSNEGYLETRRFSWVVDATGYKRSLMSLERDSNILEKKYLTGSGIEWLIKVDNPTASNWQGKVTFHLGTKFIKHGYGWIFPMDNNILKVGVCHLPPSVNESNANLAKQLRSILKFNSLDNFSIIDKHGGIISTSISRKEDHVKGRLVGVGDVVSTANLLGGEGIRHAIQSADVLAPILAKILNTDHSDLNTNTIISHYKPLLKKKLGWRWIAANRIGRRTWLRLYNDSSDKRLLKLLDGLSKKISAEELSALLFEYRFERYGLRFLPYFLGLS